MCSGSDCACSSCDRSNRREEGNAARDKYASVQKRMAKEVFRFHVLANSDSEEDQELKMKVKGEIIAYMKEDLPYSDGVETTKAWARTHTDEIEEVAAGPLKKPDIDNIVKVVADALNGAAYHDDTQIVFTIAKKAYSAVEGLDITVEEYTNGR